LVYQQLENRIVKLKLLAVALLLVVAADGGRPISAQAAKKEAAGSTEWFQFRGPARDGISAESGLLKEWPAGGPPQLWKTSGIGAGYSAISVSGTRGFTMGETGGKSYVVALNLADGKILWKTEVGKGGDTGNQGIGPRSTPATDGALVFALNHYGEIACLQAATGKPVWSSTMGKFGGTSMPGWGWSESPLLDGGQVMFTPGGSVVALNKATGAQAWQTKIKGGAHYTSLAVADIGNVRQYIAFNDQSVTGIAAKNGAMAWSVDRKGQTAICSTPAYKDGTLLVSSGYGVGHTAFKIAAAGGRFQVQEAYAGKELESHHGGFVISGDHVYGTNQSVLVCMELKTGKVAWQGRSAGKGSITLADGNLYVRGEGGGVSLVEASPTAYKEKGSFSLPKSGGNGAWAYPVVAGGKLFIREWDSMVCYDIKEK
jgi:outer membrane protein assembly factor BamB